MTAQAVTLRQVVCGHDAPSGSGGGFELVVETLSIARGEAVAFAGPSGSGKSTLLDLLALTLRPRTMTTFTLRTRIGEAIDISALWQRRDEDRLTGTRAAHLGYVLQQGGLLPFLSVRRNMALGQAVLGRPDPDRIEALARRLEIDALLDRPPATLSVGQRQRVAIGRALAHRPEIVLADEPTASVHPALADTILALLVEQARQDDTALILTTHDPDRAARHGFEVVRLATEAGSGGGRSVVHRDVASVVRNDAASVVRKDADSVVRKDTVPIVRQDGVPAVRQDGAPAVRQDPAQTVRKDDDPAARESPRPGAGPSV